MIIKVLNISHECIDKLHSIRDKYLSRIGELPKEDNWKQKTDDELWLEIFAQVVVVGNASPAEKLKENKYKQQIAYEKLKTINDDNTISTIINKVLRAIGTRYASEDATKCKKIQALAYNLKILKSYSHGIRGFFNYLGGITSERKRVEYVINHLKYIKNKGARDLLMELGLVRNAIALDVRVVKNIRHIGIDISEGYENNAKKYAEIEKDILEKVCMPLGLEGIQLDRLLFRSYEETKKLK